MKHTFTGLMMVMTLCFAGSASAANTPRSSRTSCEQSFSSCVRGVEKRTASPRAIDAHGKRLARFLAAAAKDAERKVCEARQKSCARSIEHKL